MSHQAETPHLERTSRLGEIAEVAAGQPAPGEPSAFSVVGHPFLRAGSLEGLLAGQSELEFQRIGPVTAKTLGLRLFPGGTVIFAKSGISATLGRIYRLRVPCYLTSHLAAVMPGEVIDGGYLFHWLGHNSPSDLIPNQAYPSIRLDDIKRVKITLPLLAEQKRIAAILDKADEIRRKQRDIQSLATEFERSLFLEMFRGEINRCRLLPLHVFVEEFHYGTSEKSSGSGFPTLRIPNIIGGEVDLSDLKTVAVTGRERGRLALRDGDVLFVRTNGNPDYVGRSAVFEPSRLTESGFPHDQFIYASYLIRARLKRKILNPVFLHHYLLTQEGLKSLRNNCRTSAGQYNINIAGLGAILVPSVPLRIQNRFATLVRAAGGTRISSDGRFRLSRKLFDSIQQLAFKGGGLCPMKI